MSFFNPQVVQGNLNKLYTSVFVPNFPALNVTAPYMSKAGTHLSFDGTFVNQLPTMTGIVPSPEPFIMAEIAINLLRSQGLAAAWFAQLQSLAIIGPVTICSDSTAFGQTTVSQCSVMSVDPGPFDGTDPTFKITVKGVLYINNQMWTGVSGGALGALGGLGAIGGLI
jgi:hypothetical protein